MGELVLEAFVWGLLGLSGPAVLASVWRMVFMAVSRGRQPRLTEWRPERWVVVVPARNEGRGVDLTLASIQEEAASPSVTKILVLDGEDKESRSAAAIYGFAVMCKLPAGPTKGAVLEWFSEAGASLMRPGTAVMICDVGSRLSDSFFARVTLPADAVAWQVPLAAISGDESIGHSETRAQRIEDGGRELRGWSVQLRGTGTIVRGEHFDKLARALRTAVEDQEMTWRVIACGLRSRMTRGDAVIRDVKPSSTDEAARQRARWIIGQWHLATIVARQIREGDPAESFHFLSSLVSRPLALTVALRAAAFLGGLVMFDAPLKWVIASLLVSSISIDLAAHGRNSLRLGLRMLGIWIGALRYAPAAARGWIRISKR